jgi:hypothetical protein
MFGRGVAGVFYHVRVPYLGPGPSGSPILLRLGVGLQPSPPCFLKYSG